MPRRARPRIHGQFVHAMNRRVDRTPLFLERDDYDRFASILGWAQRELDMQITSWCLMPNHWHLLLRPQDRQHLSRFMHRVETTHASAFRSHTGTQGHGCVYGGRYKSFAVPSDRLLRTAVYVERNPVKAGLVSRATAWLHSSAAGGHFPPEWPKVVRLPGELERLRPELLKRPLPGEFEREFASWCAVPSRALLAADVEDQRPVRGALEAIGRARVAMSARM